MSQNSITYHFKTKERRARKKKNERPPQIPVTKVYCDCKHCNSEFIFSSFQLQFEFNSHYANKSVKKSSRLSSCNTGYARTVTLHISK